jgi:predicted O-methyltransferase YrrM
LDAVVLFAITRRFRPVSVIEIGSGYSSLIMQRALAGRQSTHHVIEPYPRPFVEELAGTGAIKLQRKEVQQVPLEFFDQLQPGDILFIDSSHVVSIGSDVQFEILEVLPRLRPGVLVHFHDIFWPAEYPRTWVTDLHWFLNEQYMLQAFLAFNAQFEALLAVNYVQSRSPDEVKSVTGRGDTGSSFWMRRRERES